MFPLLLRNALYPPQDLSLRCDQTVFVESNIQPCLYRGCGAGFGNVGKCVPQPAAVRGKWIDHFAGKVTALEQCPHCWCVGVPPDRRAQYHSIVIFQVCGNGFQLRRKTAVDFPLSLLDHVVVAAVVSSAHEAGVPVVAPLRGKARQEVEAMGLEGIMLIEAQGYLDFSYLTAHAMGIVTDSGNVAEEATFNGVPCITLNSYTEHIETVKIGTNVLVGEDADRLVLMTKVLLRGEWKKAGIPDRWDGRSADRIVQILVNE